MHHEKSGCEVPWPDWHTASPTTVTVRFVAYSTVGDFAPTVRSNVLILWWQFSLACGIIVVPGWKTMMMVDKGQPMMNNEVL